jgi:hypothetical protein
MLARVQGFAPPLHEKIFQYAKYSAFYQYWGAKLEFYKIHQFRLTKSIKKVPTTNCGAFSIFSANP